MLVIEKTRENFMHDIFISYEHQSKSIADNIVNVLENKKIRCWYAPRDVIGDYATSICDAIENCKIFVLILNANSSNSNHCLNEVEMAYKSNIEDGSNIIIMPFRVDNNDLNRAMEYYVKRLHWIDATNRSLSLAIDEMYLKIASILGIEEEEENTYQPTIDRTENKYDSTEEYEEKRLEKQLLITKQFDQSVYAEIASKFEETVVLDVGSNDGSLIIDRLGKIEHIKKIIALEYNNSLVERANNMHDSSKFCCYQCDIEKEDFEYQLQDILKKNNIASFGIINMSMIVLHLKNPSKLFKILRKYLQKDGYIIIKDIDDGQNFAYPDEGNEFERCFKICLTNEDSGYRHSGRQIFTLLTNAGFKQIRLEKMGINTIGMDFDEKQAMFNIYFDFTLGDLAIMSKKYPNDKSVQDNYKWLSNKFSDLEDKFHENNFIFNLGMVMYTARK